MCRPRTTPRLQGAPLSGCFSGERKILGSGTQCRDANPVGNFEVPPVGVQSTGLGNWSVWRRQVSMGTLNSRVLLQVRASDFVGAQSGHRGRNLTGGSRHESKTIFLRQKMKSMYILSHKGFHTKLSRQKNQGIDAEKASRRQKS